MGNVPKELRKKYDNKSLEQIEKGISGSNLTLHKALYGMVERLFYLETSLRYRQNPEYATATFEEYTRSRFGITRSQYRSWRVAIMRFAAEAEKHGLGFVAELITKFGVKNAGKALVYVNDYVRSTPTLKKKREAVEEFARIVKPAKPKESSINWEARCLEAERQLREAQERVAELKDQNQRLITALEREKNRNHQAVALLAPNRVNPSKGGAYVTA